MPVSAIHCEIFFSSYVRLKTISTFIYEQRKRTFFSIMKEKKEKTKYTYRFTALFFFLSKAFLGIGSTKLRNIMIQQKEKNINFMLWVVYHDLK